MAAAVLTPHVVRALEGAEADGDTVALPDPPAADATAGARNLLSLFEAPEDEGPKKAKALDEDDTVKPPAARPRANSYSTPPLVPKPALVLFATVGAALLTSAAAFACSARAPASARALCGAPAHALPRRSLLRRRSASADDAGGDDDDDDARAGEAGRLRAALLHTSPEMDPADVEAVLAGMAAGEMAHLYAPAPAETCAPVEVSLFHHRYATLSRAHVLDVRAHVLARLDGSRVLHTSPEIDLKDALDLTEGRDYAHAYARPAEAPTPTDDGAFVLNVNEYVTRGAEAFLHQDPAMNIADLVPIKARTRQSKLFNKLRTPDLAR